MQGIRVAVHRVTGEIKILQSVHAADIGRLINPMQCRGQIDGAIAMGIGWALYEKMVYDANGAMVNPALRDYRIPAFADMPRSEIYFADTYDSVGPAGGEGAGRVRDQCRGAGDRQCRRQRDRRSLRGSPADARPHLREARLPAWAAAQGLPVGAHYGDGTLPVSKCRLGVPQSCVALLVKLLDSFVGLLRRHRRADLSVRRQGRCDRAAAASE